MRQGRAYGRPQDEGPTPGALPSRRLLLADPVRALRARRVVLLGAPNHGTDLAGAAAALDAGLCASICQLAPGSGLLAELNRGDETPPGPRFYSIWTAQDQTVVPPTSAQLPDAVGVPVQSVCPDEQVSHGQLPTDPVVVGMVLQALGTAPLAASDTSQCSALRALSR